MRLSKELIAESSWRVPWLVFKEPSADPMAGPAPRVRSGRELLRNQEGRRDLPEFGGGLACAQAQGVRAARSALGETDSKTSVNWAMGSMPMALQVLMIE